MERCLEGTAERRAWFHRAGVAEGPFQESRTHLAELGGTAQSRSKL